MSVCERVWWCVLVRGGVRRCAVVYGGMVCGGEWPVWCVWVLERVWRWWWRVVVYGVWRCVVCGGVLVCGVWWCVVVYGVWWLCLLDCCIVVYGEVMVCGGGGLRWCVVCGVWWCLVRW